MRSLKARLFIALGVAICLTGLAAGAFAFHWAFDEAIELQDAVLLQVGSLAVRTSELPVSPPERGVDPEARITIEQLGRPSSGGILHLSSNLSDGLQTLTRGASTWRVLVRTRADGSRIAIGQPAAARDEVAHESAIRTVLPLVVLFPLLLLLVGLILNVSFRSVSALANTLDAKQVDTLETLPLSGLPEELVPFVRSINGLLERIALMLDHQRRFIAAAAHELRTPITALGLQADNLSQTGLPQEPAERLALLKSGIRRVAHLLEQLLAASKYEVNRPRAAAITAFDSVVKSVVADHQIAAEERGIDLGFERIENVFVQADATSLSVLVRNLIDNALRHTPNGGRIDIEVRRDNGLARFEIEDSGPGIAEAHLERVFEPFFRSVEDCGEGSGLGLSIVRSIVHHAKGSIAIENIAAAERSGLRVSIAFPLWEVQGERGGLDSSHDTHA